MAKSRDITIDGDVAQSIVVTGDHNQVTLVVAEASNAAAVAAVPGPLIRSAVVPAFQSRIRAFVDSYLQSESGTVPFGGRTREIDRLCAWLANPDAAARLLIAGPAGRGKSALLVRWIERLQQLDLLAAAEPTASSRWSVVFVPISMRFGTHAQHVFYQALADRLATLQGQPLERPVTDPAGFYSDKVREALHALAESGRHVLVVIDGLDEALRGEFDETIFPRVCPPNLRIVAAARWLSGDRDASGWARRLEWGGSLKSEVLDLGMLTEAGIADVLAQASPMLQIVAADPALIARLAALTEGDPLVLHYYVLDLGEQSANSPITLDDLNRLTPGFAAYFERWLQLQRQAWRAGGEQVNQADVDAVLAVLAHAYGALEGSDLLALTATFPGTSAAFQPQQLLEPLRRFVVGDGSAARGYIFSHPRIGEFLRNERFNHSRVLAEQAFLRWGADVLAARPDTPRATQPSAYLIQFYRKHLQSAGAAPEDFIPLVTDGWRRAWERFEGGHAGFASDVQAAWNSIRSRDALALPALQIRCLFTLSSIRTLGEKVPRSLIVACVRHGVLSVEQGLHLAGLMDSTDYTNNESEPVLTVGALSQLVVGDPDRARDILDCALARARAIRDARQRIGALCGLLQYLDPAARSMTVDEMLATAPAMNDEGLHALREFAQHLDGRQMATALACARRIRHTPSRIRALIALAARLNGAQRTDIANEVLALLAHSLDADTDGIIASFFHAESFVALASLLDEEQLTRALSIAGRMRGDQANEAVSALSISLAGYGHRAAKRESLDAARAINSSYTRTKALLFAAKHLPAAESDAIMREALAGLLSDECDGLSTLCSFIGDLTGESRQVAIDRVMERATPSDDFWWSDTLGDVAHHLSGDEVREALHRATLPGCICHAQVVDGIAPRLIPEDLPKALGAAKQIGDSACEALLTLGRHLPAGERDQLVAEVLDDARRSPSNADERAFSRCEWADLLEGKQRDDVIAESLAAARTLPSPENRVRALAALLAKLAPEDRDQVVCEVFDLLIGRGAKFVELVIAALPPYCSSAQAGELLATAKAAQDEDLFALILLHLSVCLTREQVESEFDRALSLRSSGARADALTGLAAVVDEPLRSRAIRGALEAARVRTEMGYDCAHRFGRLIPYLPKDERAAVMHEALDRLRVSDHRDSALAHLLLDIAGHLRFEEVDSHFRMAREIKPCPDSIFTMICLADHMSGSARRDALQECLMAIDRLDTAVARSISLSHLTPHLDGEMRRQALLRLLRDGAELRRPVLLRDLPAFAAAIVEVGGMQALRETVNAIRDTLMWYP